jgi:hypothetical protein
VVKFFTETGLLPLCSNPQPGGVPILVTFYDMHGLQWDYSLVTTRGKLDIKEVVMLLEKRILLIHKLKLL